MKLVKYIMVLCLFCVLTGILSANAEDAPVPLSESELERKKTLTMLTEDDLIKEVPVLFQNKEFERMVYTALYRSKEDPVYPSELAAIRALSIRNGNMLFSPVIQEYVEYDQADILDLSDLKHFPNLIFLDITDMKCSEFEAITHLSELQQLILIRAGVTDCSFLSDMTLSELNLTGNELLSFTPVSTVGELKKLNLSHTGLTSLEPFRNLDLTELVIADNPISDLEPISNMSGLTCLSIQDTEVTSLDALRNLTELEELYLEDLKGKLSLEPLQNLKKLKLVFGWE